MLSLRPRDSYSEDFILWKPGLPGLFDGLALAATLIWDTVSSPVRAFRGDFVDFVYINE